MKILTPQLPVPTFEDAVLSARRDWIANAKAVAAQTYCAKDLELNYFESRLWNSLSVLFERQVRITNGQLVGQSARAFAHDAIVFPFSVTGIDLTDGLVGVWIDDNYLVRNVRLFETLESARNANERLQGIFGK